MLFFFKNVPVNYCKREGRRSSLLEIMKFASDQCTKHWMFMCIFHLINVLNWSAIDSQGSWSLPGISFLVFRTCVVFLWAAYWKSRFAKTQLMDLPDQTLKSALCRTECQSWRCSKSVKAALSVSTHCFKVCCGTGCLKPCLCDASWTRWSQTPRN